jgi:hypothetical protein
MSQSDARIRAKRQRYAPGETQRGDAVSKRSVQREAFVTHPTNHGGAGAKLESPALDNQFHRRTISQYASAADLSQSPLVCSPDESNASADEPIDCPVRLSVSSAFPATAKTGQQNKSSSVRQTGATNRRPLNCTRGTWGIRQVDGCWSVDGHGGIAARSAPKPKRRSLVTPGLGGMLSVRRGRLSFADGYIYWNITGTAKTGGQRTRRHAARRDASAANIARGCPELLNRPQYWPRNGTEPPPLRYPLGQEGDSDKCVMNERTRADSEL